MKVTEARDLLVLIESYDRRPFRPEAVDLWFEALRDVEACDAWEAVHSIFRIAGHDERGGIRQLLPVDVKRPAQAIAAARIRHEAIAAQRKAVEAPQVRRGSTGRPAAVEAALAAAREKAAKAAERYAVAA